VSGRAGVVGDGLDPDAEVIRRPGALVPLTGRQARFCADLMHRHAPAGPTGVCAVCGVPECDVYRRARADLAMAGLHDHDPIRRHHQAGAGR
jgi:hypothetical protein